MNSQLWIGLIFFSHQRAKEYKILFTQIIIFIIIVITTVFIIINIIIPAIIIVIHTVITIVISTLVAGLSGVHLVTGYTNSWSVPLKITKIIFLFRSFLHA